MKDYLENWRIFECIPTNGNLTKAMAAQRSFEIKERDIKRKNEQKLATPILDLKGKLTNR